VRATGGSWSIGTAPLGGARMEVSWHNTGGPRGNRPSSIFHRIPRTSQVKAPEPDVPDPAGRQPSAPR